MHRIQAAALFILILTLIGSFLWLAIPGINKTGTKSVEGDAMQGRYGSTETKSLVLDRHLAQEGRTTPSTGFAVQPPRLLEVHFQDLASSPIANVSLCLDMHSSEARPVRSDRNGILQVDPRGLPCEALARADGFADLPLLLTDAESHVRTVVMEKEGTISGHIQTPDGRPAQHIMALAWPSTGEHYTNRAMAARALKRDDRCTMAETDDDGDFSIGHLTPGLHYRIAAGGNGMLADDSRQLLRCPADNVKLVVRYVYCALVCVVNDSGDLIAQDDRLDTSTLMGVSSGTSVPGAQPALNGAAAILAGLPESQFHPPSGSWLWLFTWNENRPELSPVTCEVNHLGYQHLTTELAFPRFDGQVALLTISVKSSGPPLGRLFVTFSSEPSTGRRWDMPEGLLYLDTDSGQQVCFQIHPKNTSTQEFQVPQGQYFCRFRANCGSFSFPAKDEPASVVLVTDSPGRFTINSPPTGTIEIVLEPDDRDIWVHSMRCLLGMPPTDNTIGSTSLLRPRFLAVEGPPFFIRGLTTDVYAIRTLEPPSTQVAPDLVDVQPGVISRVQVKLK